jgi:hypothetical protein
LVIIVISNIFSVKFRYFLFLVKFKRFPVIPNTAPVEFKGTSFINWTGVPLIISGIHLNLNGRNLRELHFKRNVLEKLLELPWINCSCDLKEFN